jgi:hypothetical protein
MRINAATTRNVNIYAAGLMMYKGDVPRAALFEARSPSSSRSRFLILFRFRSKVSSYFVSVQDMVKWRCCDTSESVRSGWYGLRFVIVFWFIRGSSSVVFNFQGACCSLDWNFLQYIPIAAPRSRRATADAITSSPVMTLVLSSRQFEMAP